jgi:hypothetical protein
MASGTYARVALNASGNTVIVPAIAAGNTAVVTVNVVNTGTTPAVIRLAITSTANTPAANNSEYFEFNTAIAAFGVLERTGIVLSSGLSITAFANTTGVVAQTYGLETVA